MCAGHGPIPDVRPPALLLHPPESPGGGRCHHQGRHAAIMMSGIHAVISEAMKALLDQELGEGASHDFDMIEQAGCKDPQRL